MRKDNNQQPTKHKGNNSNINKRENKKTEQQQGENKKLGIPADVDYRLLNQDAGNTHNRFLS